MGNVMDCSSDPLDQIHEGPDADPPAEAGGSNFDDGDNNEAKAGTLAKPAEAERGQETRSRPDDLYLERAVPLRDSIMWKLQREYYTAHHVQCWEKMVVPCFVTSNAFIARAYARILLGFIRDWFEGDNGNTAGRTPEPILVLEIGAGHGKFACLVLQQLLEMKEFMPTLNLIATRAEEGNERQADGEPSSVAADLPFRYVVTDIAQGTLDYVRSHSSMQNFIKMGLLEVALLDAEDPDLSTELLLQISGDTVDLKSRQSPVAAVCNYVFDSLQQDAFRVKGKTLYENRVSITASRPLPEDLSQLALNALNGLGLKWEHIPHEVPPDRAKNYYSKRREERQRCAVEVGEERSQDQDVGQESRSGSPLQREGESAEGDLGKSCPPTDAEGKHDAPGNASSCAVDDNQNDHEVPDDEQRNRGDGVSGVAEKNDRGSSETPNALEHGTQAEAEASTSNGTNYASGEEDRPEMPPPAGQTRTGTDSHVEAAGRGNLSRQSLSRDDPDKRDFVNSQDADFDELLASYLDGSSDEEGSSLLLPLGGLHLLRYLSTLSCGKALVLVGDKGYVSTQEMTGQRNPHIAYHGSLSCMVNMDALARYTRQRGGWALSSPYMEGFKCQALSFGLSKESLEETRLAFDDATQAFGPESFSTLQRAVRDEVAQPSLGLITRLLRLAQLDPDVFMKFRTTLVEQVSSQELAPPVWEDLKNDALVISEKWYPLQQGKDVNFEVARLLMALKDFESALHLFERSNSICGEHYVTCHNMGMTYFYMGKLKQAKECFERSLAMNQTYEDSIQWLDHVTRSLSPPSGPELLSRDTFVDVNARNRP